MTVAALAPSISYVENGVSLTFAVPFRYLDPTNLTVERIGSDGLATALAYGTDWSATAGPTDAGGTVTLVASVAGNTLRIRRVTPRAQATDYVANDRFPAETHEGALDRAMLIDQEQDVKISDVAARALQVLPGEVMPALPTATQRASQLLGFDGSGQLALFAVSGALPITGTALIASEALAKGAFVNIFNNAGQVAIRNADANDPNKMADGFVLAAVAPGGASFVIMSGLNSSVTVAAFGEAWLSKTAVGSFSIVPLDPADVANSGKVLQRLGKAIPGVGILFNPIQGVVL